MVLATVLSVVVPGRLHAEPLLGITVDAGVPDGANAAFVVRPIRAVRLHAGGGTNAISRGVRAGITLVPLPFWLSPTLSVDYGRYPEGNANPAIRSVTGDDSFSVAMLEHVGYSYTNAHLGLEFGRHRTTFYLHAGASYITSKLRDLDASSRDGSTSVTFTTDPDVAMWAVSARIGLVVYFL